MQWGKAACLKADLHVHTVASGHAFGTVQELMNAANQREMRVLGISDHGPTMDGAPQAGYFTMTPDFRNWPGPPTLLFGCEANVLDMEGSLDLDPQIQSQLDYVMIGLHARTPYDSIKNCTENNTRALKAALKRHRPAIVSHPVNLRFPIRIDEIVQAAAETGTALEINARVLAGAPEAVIEEHRHLIRAASHAGVRLILGSDAHIPPMVGNVSSLSALQNDLAVAAGLIVNWEEASFWPWFNGLSNRAGGKQ